MDSAAPQIDMQTQKILNTPLKADGGMTQEDEKILDLIVAMVNEGKINIYQPSTLVNQSVYEKLGSSEKGKVDFESLNMLSAIREIKGMLDAGFRETYQMANLVSRMRATKERIELERGDIFII